jgi:hypothetical protein
MRYSLAGYVGEYKKRASGGMMEPRVTARSRCAVLQRNDETPMTEQEWSSCTDCDAMLRFLQGSLVDRVLSLLRVGTPRRELSPRKLRLYYCACARAHPRVAADVGLRDIVGMAERYADGEVAREELESTIATLVSAHHRSSGVAEFLTWRTLDSAQRLQGLLYRATDTQSTFMSFAIERGYSLRVSDRDRFAETERRVWVNLVREIFGNPHRKVSLDPRWLLWNDGGIARLASDIYAQRKFTELPVLADALEEAGCREEMILSHCREATDHARGCWVIDLLLGKR